MADEELDAIWKECMKPWEHWVLLGMKDLNDARAGALRDFICRLIPTQRDARENEWLQVLDKLGFDPRNR